MDGNGDIDFPILGKLHVAGLTRMQLTEMIKQRLIEGDLIKDPIVTVQFLSLIHISLQMALNAARAGKSVCFFSLEMSSLQMLNRVLAGMTDVNPDHLRINKPTGRELLSLIHI